jgi:hypothetical protein
MGIPEISFGELLAALSVRRYSATIMSNGKRYSSLTALLFGMLLHNVRRMEHLIALSVIQFTTQTYLNLLVSIGYAGLFLTGIMLLFSTSVGLEM